MNLWAVGEDFERALAEQTRRDDHRVVVEQLGVLGRIGESPEPPEHERSRRGDDSAVVIEDDVPDDAILGRMPVGSWSRWRKLAAFLVAAGNYRPFA